ncbi:MAG: glycosyltransferase family 2 protein [Candidatus Omnitrophica bacterium]|nr:glycosyltransferase family 2 protein [Candidatus Omnitrophota bacterium]
MCRRLSAVILAKNEGGRIPACLASLGWVDEIVVVDDESTDRTRELCRAFGATVITRRSGGDFDQQRNAGIDAASWEWILQLDADEVVSPALGEEIRSAIQRASPTGRDAVGGASPIVAYRVRRQNIFLGREMRYGGWGWNGVKLFRKSAARYVGHSVHETLAVNGQVAELTQPIQHYPFQSLTQFLERQNFYSDVEARLLRQSQGTMTERALRYQLLIRPLKLFWKSYVKQGGYREGLHGLVFAALFAWTHFLKWAKWWEAGLTLAQPQPLGSVEPVHGMSSRAAGQPAGMARDRETLSVVILTKNEEERIGRCLASVRWADEVIVVDGESQDRTPELARAFGATVVSHAFDGSLATERNLGLSHAHGDWVLQIDADDVVTQEFHATVDAVLREKPSHAAYKFRRRSVLLGRVMRYGGWYYAVPNLLRRGRARYEGLVHERPSVEGTIGELNADIEHHPCERLSVFVGRHNRYTSLQAEELCRTLGTAPDRRLWRLLWRMPWKTFWKSYVKKAGYREGLHGLVFAELYAGFELLKWAKYWERSRLQPP